MLFFYFSIVRGILLWKRSWRGWRGGGGDMYSSSFYNYEVDFMQTVRANVECCILR